MKKLNALIMLSFGVLASSSGMLQTQAALFTFSVNFSTKEVANFNAFKQSFNANTYGLNARLITTFAGAYKLDSCPTAFTINMEYSHQIRINGTGSSVASGTNALPDWPCSTTLQTYNSVITSANLPSSVISALMNDDANFIQIRSIWNFNNSTATNGRVLELSNYRIDHTIEYSFDTTYLFNYFLSDTQYVSKGNPGVGTWNFRSDDFTKVNYLFTTTGNDEYRIVNTDFLADLGTARKKYAVNYNDEFFRGTSIGANISRNFITDAPYNTDTLTMVSGGQSQFVQNYNYYYLNSANLAQAIVNVPQISFTSQTCSGGFLDINVGCYVNNALAYLTNTAPVISDLTTIVNTGIEFAGQTFGVIGNFTTSNMFGYLILGGFGFIAVKWLFKDDK
jgi:hypothetical protein